MMLAGSGLVQKKTAQHGDEAGPPFIGCYGGICIRSCVTKLPKRHSTFGAGKKERRIGCLLISLLAEVPAAALATKNCSWLADEAIANRIAVIVTAAVAVIVGI
jgi:hypothetical protein